ncbi:MAG: hypothetical protein NTV94_02630 [Planctomycetota bacterium]|nr:hypothetical protein [Planctomycetota bacterium]
MPPAFKPEPTDRAYVVLTAWPESGDAGSIAAKLVRGCSIDAVAASNLLNKPLPAIVRRIDVRQAPVAVSNLEKLGFGAFWVGLAEMESRVASRPAKRVAPALGAPQPMFMVECWPPHDAMGLLGSNIRLLVRGRPQQTKVQAQELSPGGSYYNGIDDEGWHADLEGGGASARRTAIVTEVLDVHLFDNTCIRCNASRFHFTDLGGPKRYSDAENLDALTTLLANDSPQALIDTQFRTRRCPSEPLIDMRAVTSATGDARTLPAFGVYSAWAACLAARGIAW